MLLAQSRPIPEFPRSEGPPQPPVILRFGRCEVRCDTRELFVDGRPQPVRRRVFDLIVYLVQQRPRAVPHVELLQRVWQRREASPSLLARAIMEARRAVGDTADEASIFVSVHGVGYRFAGGMAAVATRPAGDDTRGDADDPVTRESVAVRELVLQARHAIFERRYDRARELADQAMVRADGLGSHAEKVRAMLVRGSVALNLACIPEAARLFADAMRIARAEGHPALIAESRLYTGGLHVVAGDPELAMQHLRAAMEVYAQPGHEADLIRCLNWLAQALRRQGELEAGLQTCRRSIELGSRLGGQNYAILDRVNEVRFLVTMGDRDAAMGETGQARAHYETGLARNETLLCDLKASGNHLVWLTALGNQALLLERTHRLSEAWAVTQQVQQEMAALPPEHMHLGPGNRPLVLMQKARLLARSGRVAEAMTHARLALDEAERAEHHARELDELYRQAASVAEQAGNLEAALRWQRACSDELVRMHRGKAASLAAVLAAELNADDLQTQLDSARAAQQALQQEAAALRQQLQQLQKLQGSVPVCPDTGLAGPSMLEQVFVAAHAHARARELPMCIVLLSLENAADLQALHGPQVVAGLWRQVSELAGRWADLMQPAVELGGGRVAIGVRDAGPARARVLGQELVAQLQGLLGRDPALAIPPRWRWSCADAARQATVQACIDELLAA